MMIDTLKLKEALDKQDTSAVAEILAGADMSDFATKSDIAEVKAEINGLKEQASHFATKADLYRALGIQTFAMISAVVALIKLL